MSNDLDPDLAAIQGQIDQETTRRRKARKGNILENTDSARRALAMAIDALGGDGVMAFHSGTSADELVDDISRQVFDMESDEYKRGQREALRAFASRIGNDATSDEQTHEQLSEDLAKYVAWLEDRAKGCVLYALLERMGTAPEGLRAVQKWSTADLEVAVMGLADLYTLHLPKAFAVVAQAAGGEACLRAFDVMAEGLPEDQREAFLQASLKAAGLP
jgi:hypothetical protein